MILKLVLFFVPVSIFRNDFFKYMPCILYKVLVYAFSECEVLVIMRPSICAP